MGVLAAPGAARDTVCTTAWRTSHDQPVPPPERAAGRHPQGRQPVSSVPSAPPSRDAHDQGRSGRSAAARPARTRLGRLAPRAALLALLAMATTGCTPDNAFTRLGMPAPVTRQGHVILTLWQGSWIAAWIVGAVVWGLIIWACIFHTKRRGSAAPPHQVRYNLPIEMLYTVVPFIMVGVLFFFTARDDNRRRLPVELAVPVQELPGTGLAHGLRNGERRTVEPADGQQPAPGACHAGKRDGQVQ